MIKEAEKVRWVPNIAKDRFENLLKSAPDWCISRQRYWGIPLPIWVCKDCGHIHVIGSREELPEKLEDLHRPYIDKVKLKCEKCGGEMERVPDVLDVWFDSGNAVWSSQGGEWGETADYILEGHDQIRGWFYSILGSGVIYNGKVPYKTVVMHGFFVDEKGEKMSKSVGNYVPLDEIVTRGGVDSFRLFSLSTNVWEDPRFSWDAIKEAKADIGVFLNLISFLERHYKEKIEDVPSEELSVEDRWMLSRVYTTLKEYHKALSQKEIAKAVRMVRSLLIDDLSKGYMKVAKQRIANDENKRAALYTIYTAVWNIALMLSPITPLATEHVYQNFFKAFEGKEESIHLYNIPDEKAELIDTRLETLGTIAFDIISKGLMLRNVAKVKLRWPLAALYVLDDTADVKEATKKFNSMIMKLVNVKTIKTEKDKEELVCDDEGKICLDGKVTEELYEEGMANEIIRRVQMVRKEKSLVESNIVPITLGGDAELVEIAKKFADYIKRRTHASELTFGISPEEEQGAKSFMVDGKPLLIKL